MILAVDIYRHTHTQTKLIINDCNTVKSILSVHVCALSRLSLGGRSNCGVCPYFTHTYTQPDPREAGGLIQIKIILTSIVLHH
jgi:hypothetical protein